MRWMRAADYEPGGEHYDEPNEQEYNEPIKARGISSMAIQLKGSNRKYNNATTKAIRVAEDDDICADRISFQVFPASGGVAVQVQSYDRHHDERSTKLHVIPEDKDLAESLAHILSLESMRR